MFLKNSVKFWNKDQYKYLYHLLYALYSDTLECLLHIWVPCQYADFSSLVSDQQLCIHGTSGFQYAVSGILWIFSGVFRIRVTDEYQYTDYSSLASGQLLRGVSGLQYAVSGILWIYSNILRIRVTDEYQYTDYSSLVSGQLLRGVSGLQYSAAGLLKLYSDIFRIRVTDEYTTSILTTVVWCLVSYYAECLVFSMQCLVFS